jgi:L,D-transpeptidase ErfK/SrfK
MRPLDRVLLVTASAVLGLSVAFSSLTAGAGSRGSLTGGVHRYVTVAGDTWALLEARFGVDARTLIADNGLTTGRPLPAGLELRVDNRHIVPGALERVGLVINVPQRMLFHDAGEMVMGAPLAVGKPSWRTPLGAFTIIAHEEDPTWDVPASIMAEARRAGRQLPASVPPGPSNPLGKYWLGLSIGGVGIHGTNAPSSIYHAVTHGCMRLAAADIATLFARVSPGTAGVIVYEPVLMALDGGEILLEVHPDIYRRVPDAAGVAHALARSLGVEQDVDWALAGQIIAARHGVARQVSAR